jgi:hypothetical protein
MLVRERETILSNVADENIKDIQQSKIEDVEKITTLCFLCLDGKEIFKGYNPIFNKDVYFEWLRQLTKWGHFDSGIYCSVRLQEQELIKKMTEKIAAGNSSEILNNFPTYDLLSGRQPQAGFEKITIECLDVLKRALIGNVLELFEKPNGINGLWDKEYRAEKTLITSDNEFFFNSECIIKLKELSTRSKENNIIHENFIKYLRMLFYSAIDVTSWGVTNEQSLEVIKKEEFIKIIWEGVISKGLNRRTVGSIEGHRKKIIEKIGCDLFPLPIWWQEEISDMDSKRSEA